MKKVIFLLAVLLCTYSVFSQTSQLIDGVIGVVGSKVILHSEVEGQIVQAKRENIPMGDNAPCLIYQDLLFQALLVNQAEIDSVVVSEDQVNAELDNRIRYFEQQIGGREKLEEFYGKSIVEIKDEFYKLIESRMLADQMKASITANTAITPKEVRKYYKSLNYDSIPLVGSKVQVSQITIAPKVSDEVKAKTKAKLEEYRQAILKGERTFATTAVLYSKDPGSRSNGGEFGWVDRGTFVPEFDRTAFSMKEGDISEVFETEYGFHILELFERRGERYKGRHILLIPEVDTKDLIKAKSELDSIYGLIEKGTYTFEEAAKEFSDDEETKFSGGLIYNQNTASSKFEMAELDKDLFVVVDKMEVGDISKPVYTEKRDKAFYRLVKLTSITDPHQANLDDDYQLIQNMALADIKAKSMNDWIREKTADTYIKLGDDFKDCSFVSDWIK